MSRPVELEGVTLQATERGVKVCARVEVAGRTVPVCREIPYEDLERELRNAGRLVESWWKRIWRRFRR